MAWAVSAPSHDRKGSFEVIERVISNPEYSAVLAAKGHARFLAHFDARVMGRRYCTAIKAGDLSAAHIDPSVPDDTL